MCIEIPLNRINHIHQTRTTKHLNPAIKISTSQNTFALTQSKRQINHTRSEGFQRQTTREPSKFPRPYKFMDLGEIIRALLSNTENQYKEAARRFVFDLARTLSLLLSL